MWGNTYFWKNYYLVIWCGVPRVNWHPEGVFRDPARRCNGGGAFRPSTLPAICQTNGLIIDPTTAFHESSGLEISEYVAKFYLNVTDYVTGRVKGQILEHLTLLTSPDKEAVSDWNKAHGTTWIVPGILLSAIISLLWPCVKSRSSRVTRPKRSNLKFWVWMVWYVFLGQIFVENAKNDPKTLFKRH